MTRARTTTTRRLLTTAAIGVVVVTAATGCYGTWGLRTSYRNYVTSNAAQGTITTHEGTTWTDGPGTGKGPFQWTIDHAAFDESTETGYVQFSGGFSTSAHPTANGPILDLSIWNPRLEIAGDVGTLYADLNVRPYVSFNPSPVPSLVAAPNTAFATVDLSGVDWTASDGAFTISNAPTTGIPAAMQLIGWDSFYPGGPVALDPLSVTFWPGAPTLAATPKIVVSQTSGLRVGDQITVWGSGFDPSGNLGTRPPLSGQPAGNYVVFGTFADVWRPSAGAPSASRTVLAQRWALPAASHLALDPTQTNPTYVRIDATGHFTATLTISASAVAGNYGVYTFPGSGASNAAHELYTPITFAP